MTHVLGFSQPFFAYQDPPLLIGMQMAGVNLFEAFKVCIFLALAGVVLLFPLGYWWWGLLDFCYPRLNQIIKGRCSVTPDTALRLSR